MEKITKKQLKKMLENNEEFVLINVLRKEYFKQGHINGSINIPISDENFDKEIMQKIKEMDKKIVVYCANKHCSASPRAAKHLEQLGFKNVYDYEGGIEEWDGDYCFEKEGENICMKENKKTEEKEICSVC